MKLEPQPLPSELTHNLDSVSRGILLWDPALCAFLREQCQSNTYGQILLKHRRRLYLCVTRSEEINALRHPSIDVLAPWPRGGGPLESNPGLGLGTPERETDLLQAAAVDTLRDSWREQYKARWHPGAILSLPHEAQTMTHLLLESLGFLPDSRIIEDRKLAEETLAWARHKAFGDDSTYRQANVLKRKTGRFRAFPLMISGSSVDPATRSEPQDEKHWVRNLYRLGQAGPELELAILAAFLVFIEEGERGVSFCFPGEPKDPGWIRAALLECWRLLPPRWIQGKMTCHEYRLGSDRIPPGIVLLFCPHLLEGVMDFEHFGSVEGCLSQDPRQNPEVVWGEMISPFASHVLDGISALFEEIFANYQLGPVPGHKDWQLWKRRDMRALAGDLPFHVI